MTKDHETEPDDLVERLEDSRGWPNLGKAAAARIRALEAEKKELALDVLAAQGQAADLEAEKARLRYVLGGVAAAIDTGRNEPLVIWREQIEIARAALEEKNDD